MQLVFHLAIEEIPLFQRLRLPSLTFFHVWSASPLLMNPFGVFYSIAVDLAIIHRIQFFSSPSAQEGPSRWSISSHGCLAIRHSLLHPRDEGGGGVFRCLEKRRRPCRRSCLYKHQQRHWPSSWTALWSAPGFVAAPGVPLCRLHGYPTAPSDSQCLHDSFHQRTVSHFPTSRHDSMIPPDPAFELNHWCWRWIRRRCHSAAALDFHLSKLKFQGRAYRSGAHHIRCSSDGFRGRTLFGVAGGSAPSAPIQAQGLGCLRRFLSSCSVSIVSSDSWTLAHLLVFSYFPISLTSVIFPLIFGTKTGRIGWIIWCGSEIRLIWKGHQILLHLSARLIGYGLSAIFQNHLLIWTSSMYVINHFCFKLYTFQIKFNTFQTNWTLF